ncbi:hypothetical protein L7F22_028631 [Adiantum nelumboides]|nr:hypothetical protein [Adiantum nelumboides]
MADNNKENRMSIDDFDFAHEDANDDTSMLVNYLVTQLHQAMGNLALQGKVQQQFHAYGILPPIQQERGLERFQGETSKRGLSTEKRVENPYHELKKLLEGKPSSKKKGHAQHERSSSKEREESELSDESMEDVAPREVKNSKKKKEKKRSPSSPSSPSSSSDEGSGYSSQERQRRVHQRSYAARKRSGKLKKFKEGGKNISFLTYDGTFGATDKVLTFIQHFDAAFGDEGFTESTKLRHVAMHFQKSTKQWWASLRANGEAPKTWKALIAFIMKQFLASDAKDKVLTEWRSLKLSPYESIHKYVDRFWDLHLKATVHKRIDFEEQMQQFCAGLPEDMNEYVNSQRPRSISAVIHHTMVAASINFQQGAKRNLKPMEAKEKQEYKGKNFSQNTSKGNSNNNKAKEKGVFKGKNKLTPKELECNRKENECFKCGQRNPRNEQPRASMVEAPKEEVHCCKGSSLSYAWGKVREHDAFILFDPSSTHNFISLELATKLGLQDFEMGDAMKANGAFINQEVSVTPLIGKLRLHIQGYVDKEDFFISPLKHEDVILGAPWFDRLSASIKFPERKISFKFMEKDMYINAQESGSSIPLVNDQAFDKSRKSSIFAYMIFVKYSLNGVDETQGIEFSFGKGGSCHAQGGALAELQGAGTCHVEEGYCYSCTGLVIFGMQGLSHLEEGPPKMTCCRIYEEKWWMKAFNFKERLQSLSDSMGLSGGTREHAFGCQLVFVNGPFEKWGIDSMGPLLKMKNGKLYILVAIDYMTRWIKAQSVARVNERIVSRNDHNKKAVFDMKEQQQEDSQGESSHSETNKDLSNDTSDEENSNSTIKEESSIEVMVERFRPNIQETPNRGLEEVGPQENQSVEEEEFLDNMLSTTHTREEREEFKRVLRKFPRLFCSRALHAQKVEEGLRKIYDLGGQLNSDKFHIGEDEVILLGHKVSYKGIEVDPSKAKALIDLPSPKSLKEQDPHSTRMRPVYFASRVMSALEKDYTEAEFVMLALIFAVRKFRSYLLPKPFVILIVENLFPWVSSQMMLSSRISKWIMELQEFEYSFKVEDSLRAQLAGILAYKVHERDIKVLEV